MRQQKYSGYSCDSCSKKNSDLWFILVEHELNESNEYFYIKTCDSKIIRVIRAIRVQKNSDLWFILVEHELNELNEYFYIKTCDSKIIRVIRAIRVQKKLRSVVSIG